MKRRIVILCLLLVCVIVTSACDKQSAESKKASVSRDEMREVALSCFDEHKEEMEEIVASQSTIGDLDWGENYSRFGDGSYDFILVKEGFAKVYVSSGIRYCPDDKPSSVYEWEEKDGTYSYENDPEHYYMERIEKCWFFYYSEYDA